MVNLLNNLVMGLVSEPPGKFCIIRPLRTHLRLSEIAKQIEIKGPKCSKFTYNLVMGLGGETPGKFCIIRPLRTHLRLSEKVVTDSTDYILQHC